MALKMNVIFSPIGYLAMGALAGSVATQETCMRDQCDTTCRTSYQTAGAAFCSAERPAEGDLKNLYVDDCPYAKDDQKEKDHKHRVVGHKLHDNAEWMKSKQDAAEAAVPGSTAAETDTKAKCGACHINGTSTLDKICYVDIYEKSD